MITALPIIFQGLLAAISAAPKIIEVVQKAKELIAALFTAKMISKEQQDAMFLGIDAHCALINAGVIEPEFVVEPDPVP